MKKIFRVLLIAILILLLIPVGVVFLRPNKIIGKDKAKTELSKPDSHFIQWRDAEIHYTDEGGGFPVLMIHGFGGSYANFQKLADLMKNDYRVIRVDLPGFGLSDFPTTTENENYVADYKEYLGYILDTLHLDSVYVIGNSMGGGMTWLMAADHPEKVKKIVLLDPAGYDTKDVAAKLAMFKYKSVATMFDRGMPLFMSESGAAKSYYRDEKIESEVVELNNHFTNREGNIKHMLNMARSQQFADSAWIQNVHCPTLIVWGKQDEIIPLEHAYRFQRDIKGSELVLFDSCGHCPMMEMPLETRETIVKFFKE